MRWIAIGLAAACACRSAPAPATLSTATPAPATVADPPRGKVKVITETQISILDPIKFLPGSPTLDATSIPALDAMATTLAGNPSIKLVAVQTFGADTVATFQASLGTARAQTLVDALVARGISPKRLIAEGYPKPPAGRSNDPSFLILERTD
ncbi:MAG TPA: OmpA family protein [Kofleriaceae bacterium]